MGYSDYLKQLFQPLGVYELEEGLGAEEIAVIGRQLDKIFDALEELGRESLTAQAESYGLSSLEELLPYTPAYITTEDERRALMALLRIRGGCFTQAMLSDTLSGCGIAAEIEEANKALTVNISFPENKGIPEGFDGLKRRIEEIIPCHLAAVYRFAYSTWQMLMNTLLSFAAVEANAQSWRELEIYE